MRRYAGQLITGLRQRLPLQLVALVYSANSKYEAPQLSWLWETRQRSVSLELKALLSSAWGQEKLPPIRSWQVHVSFQRFIPLPAFVNRICFRLLSRTLER